MHRSRNRTLQRAFTLIELLVVVAVIGALSSLAAVSYQAVRRGARDTVRVSDMRQMQTALELYFETHQRYPFDGEPGDIGLPLGLPLTVNFSDAGFAPDLQGTEYMVGVPRNPQPSGGYEYVYRSLHRDGENCDDRGGCGSYAILFVLEGESGSLGAGPHALTPDGIAGEGHDQAGVSGPGGLIIGLQQAQRVVSRYTGEAAGLVGDVIDNEQVEETAKVAAPVAAALALVNTGFSLYNTASLASLLLYVLTQPFLLFSGRKRRAWGVVYNSLSKLPVDLAMVRLIDAGSGRRAKTAVTDREGRFSFLVNEGRYRLEAAKPGFLHPSQYIVNVAKDGRFDNVYTV
ncbi:carboxypeptidase regulatory-like domain-containing protein, partial [Patescibacteria group bacterium]